MIDTRSTLRSPRWIRVATAVFCALAAAAAVAAFAGTRPDPAAQAQKDGCGRNAAAFFKKESPTWVYVNDAATSPDGPPPAPQTASGVVGTSPLWLGTHPSNTDDPVSHSAFDFIVNVKPDSPYEWLMGTGNFVGAGEVEEGGRLHTEWQENAFPMFAWPSSGDRVQLTGNWVWDCGHWLPGGERTELHPLRAVWVQRAGASPHSPAGEVEGDLAISTDGTPASASAECAHKTRGDAAAFKECLAANQGWQSVNGSYLFLLPAPRRPSANARLLVRVADAGSTTGAPVVRAAAGVNGAVVTVDVNRPTGARVVIAKRVFVRWTTAPKPVHLRVTFDRILVRRAMDPGCLAPCRSAETTLVGQISKSPGEWVLYSSVAGVWSRWPLLRPTDGQALKLGRITDVYVGAQQPWRLLVAGRECDNGSLSALSITTAVSPCPSGTGEFLDLTGDDDPGVVTRTFASPRAAVGAYATDSLVAGSTCPPVNTHGCYRLFYRVAIVR